MYGTMTTRRRYTLTELAATDLGPGLVLILFLNPPNFLVINRNRLEWDCNAGGGPIRKWD